MKFLSTTLTNHRRVALVVGALIVGIGLAGVGVAVARNADDRVLQQFRTPVDAHADNPIRVTIASGCPASIKGHDGVSNPTPNHLRSIIAPSNPTGGLVCRYTPMLILLPGHDKHGALYRSASLSEKNARRLVDEMQGIQKKALFAHNLECPQAPFEEFDIIVLSYPDRPDLDLLVSTAGCGNGFNNGYAGWPAALYHVRVSGGTVEFFSIENVQWDEFVRDLDSIAGPRYLTHV